MKHIFLSELGWQVMLMTYFYIQQLFSNPIWKIVYSLQRKNGFFQNQPNFPCFSDLPKCNCKLISNVGFCLWHFDRSASSFFHRLTHGLCQVQLLSWFHWPESIHRRGNALHYNMCLVNRRLSFLDCGLFVMSVSEISFIIIFKNKKFKNMHPCKSIIAFMLFFDCVLGFQLKRQK